MAEREPGSEPGQDARLRSLDERLRGASDAARTGAEAKGVGADAGYRLGNRVLAELIGGMAGGALIGWVIDRLFDTSPWALLALLFLGTAVAFRNIFRLANRRPD